MRAYSIVVLLAVCAAANALFFVVGEGEKRCFIEEVPSDTLVVGNFEFSPFITNVQAQQSLAVNFLVMDPEGHVVVEQTKHRQARIAFTSHEGGDYQICLQTDTNRWFGGGLRLRVDLDIQVGASQDYANLAKTENLSYLEVGVRKLIDRMSQIRLEQSYQKHREARFRNTSESTNTRVLWFSLLQIIILSVSVCAQTSYLKGYFKAKKMV